MKTVYFRNIEDKYEIGITENGELQAFYRLEKDFCTGSIYCGKVRLVKKQIGIFVDIGKEKDGLLTYRQGLKPGDFVLVQVEKEPMGNKGCALTEKITIAGRYSVLNDIGEYKFSRKLSEIKKNELFGLVHFEEVGYIYRSVCENADSTEIVSEAKILYEKYLKIKESFKNLNKITCLYADTAENIAKRYAPSDNNVIYGFEDIENQIKKLGERKVVAEGVELVFDKTEAMTVVDVNMHKFDKQYGDLENATFKANEIAVKELARQIRLRNIGGIIMVDFISLALRENIEKLKNILVDELKKDNVRVSVELVESIGMFAIVRKRRYSSV